MDAEGSVGVDYCAACGEWVEAPVGSLSGFPICRNCGVEWIRELVRRKSLKKT